MHNKNPWDSDGPYSQNSCVSSDLDPPTQHKEINQSEIGPIWAHISHHPVFIRHNSPPLHSYLKLPKTPPLLLLQRSSRIGRCAHCHPRTSHRPRTPALKIRSQKLGIRRSPGKHPHTPKRQETDGPCPTYPPRIGAVDWVIESKVMG